jgi:6-phosphogluconolactonase
MSHTQGALRVFANAQDLARGAAEFVCDTAERSTGRFVISLAGGSTPKPMYQLLAQEPLRSRMPWDRVHWILGDERFVRPMDPASNFGMICDAMLSHVPAPKQNLHPVPTEDVTLDQSTEQYEETLQSLYGNATLSPGKPLIDLCLLGMGDDGHTASLIPGQPVLEERRRWVAAVGHGRPEPRITLTYPALESSRIVAFLVSGKGKQATLDQILSGHSNAPAARLKPAGQTVWFVDREAAGRWAS